MKLKYPQENYSFKLIRGSSKSKALFGSIPSILQSLSNFSLNSSKELTIKEQRMLAELLRVVLDVVNLLELRLLDCHMLVLGCVLKTLFPCLALQNPIVSNVLHYN